MSLKSYISPQVLAKFQSQYNSDIELVRFSGSLRLDMGGLTQSGWIIERIWGSALKKLLPHDFTPKSILILGLGAGSSAKLVSRRYPGVAITGVEIDPVVLDIGKQYFKTDQIPNLEIINLDAVKYISDLRSENFDLILVDCYLGDQVPAQLSSLTFLKRLTQISPHVLINRLFWADYQKHTLTWLDQISPDFSYTTARTPSNLVVSINALNID